MINPYIQCFFKIYKYMGRKKCSQNAENTSVHFIVFLQMGLVGQMASLRIERGTGYSQEQLDDRNRQVEWERGQIDYMGIDSFSNIQVSF